MSEQPANQAEVASKIERLTGIHNARELLPYIGGRDNPHRARVWAAMQTGDGGALSAYCAKAVERALNDAGLEAPVDARILRGIAKASDGWMLVHGVASGRENAAAILRQRIQRFQQANGQAGPEPGGQASREQQRAAPEPARAPAQQQAPQRREQAPPPRRHDSSTVRQIGEARRAREEREAPPQTQTEVTYDSVKVHGGKSALTLEASNRRDDSPTIKIEAAKIKDPANRTYDWANKIIIQLTGTELQHVTCLLYGMIDRVKFQNHGPANDKWFEIERQTGQYAGTIKFAVGQGKEMCLVQLTPADLGNVLGLFIRRCARQMNLEQGALYGALRPVAVALNDLANRGGGSRSRTG